MSDELGGVHQIGIVDAPLSRLIGAIHHPTSATLLVQPSPPYEHGSARIVPGPAEAHMTITRGDVLLRE